MLRFNLNGPEGNIFYILGSAYSQLVNEGKKELAEEMKNKVTSSKDYETAKLVIAEYVDVEYVEK